MRKWLLILKHAFRRGWVLVWAFPLALLSCGMALLQPWPMKVLVDNVLGSSRLPRFLEDVLNAVFTEPTRLDLLKIVAVCSVVIFVINRLAEALLAWISIRGSWGTVYSLGREVFGRLQERSLAFHRNTAVGELMTRVLGDCRCAQEFLENILFASIIASVTIAGMLLLMCRINVALTLLVFAAIPFSWVIEALASKRLRTAAKLNREIEGQIQSQLQQTFSGIGVVQAFGQEDREQRRFLNLVGMHIRRQKKSFLLNHTRNFATGLVMVLVSGAVLWLIARQVLRGETSLGSALVFLAYFNTLQGQLAAVRNLSGAFHVVGENADRVVQVLETPLEVDSKPNAVALRDVRGNVEFRNVTAGYKGKPVLKNVSFKAAPGQTIAIVGPTGSGKTTLASLILRSEDPWEGSVLIDGQDLRDLELKSLRSQVAVVLQEPFLLPDTVAANIAYGRPEATRADIESAARDACAHGFIAGLPQGYDTIVEERGATFSGGMRQRIAIARALLKRAPILILDEPSSALDGETERLIFQALEKHRRKCTTFVITHRLSTIRDADVILVLRDGSIVESGSHAAMQAKGGYYAQMQGIADNQAQASCTVN